MTDFLIYLINLCKTVDLEKSVEEEHNRYKLSPFHHRMMAMPEFLKMRRKIQEE
jgi:hypothetical protein